MGGRRLSSEFYRLVLTHFAAGGVDGSSLSRIAGDAELPLATVLDAHESADHLFDAAVAQATAALIRELVAIAEGDDEPASRLMMMTKRLATPEDIERVALFAVYRELLDGNERAERVFDSCMRSAFDAFVVVLGEAQFRGQIAPLPPRFVLSVLLSGIVVPQLIGLGGAEGALQGVHAPEPATDGGESSPSSALLAASLEAVFHGVLTERGRHPDEGPRRLH